MYPFGAISEATTLVVVTCLRPTNYHFVLLEKESFFSQREKIFHLSALSRAHIFPELQVTNKRNRLPNVATLSGPTNSTPTKLRKLQMNINFYM